MDKSFIHCEPQTLEIKTGRYPCCDGIFPAVILFRFIARRLELRVILGRVGHLAVYV
jgi:hypothetical protein